MKRGTGILPKKAAVMQQVRGDCLGVAADRDALEALVEATRRRYLDEPTEDTKRRYLAMIRAASPGAAT